MTARKGRTRRPASKERGPVSLRLCSPNKLNLKEPYQHPRGLRKHRGPTQQKETVAKASLSSPRKRLKTHLQWRALLMASNRAQKLPISRILNQVAYKWRRLKDSMKSRLLLPGRPLKPRRMMEKTRKPHRKNISPKKIWTNSSSLTLSRRTST
jgi:hypothetical protein